LPEQTAKVTRGDWVVTGDLARFDEEGYVYLVDRKNDMIISGGENVYPREVEEILLAHPAVAECGVAGLPDAARGEILKAWIVLRPGMSVTPDELKAFCRETLAPYKVPSRWEFVSELPKSAIGKVLRRKLRERELDGSKPTVAVIS